VDNSPGLFAAKSRQTRFGFGKYTRAAPLRVVFDNAIRGAFFILYAAKFNEVS